MLTIEVKFSFSSEPQQLFGLQQARDFTATQSISLLIYSDSTLIHLLMASGLAQTNSIHYCVLIDKGTEKKGIVWVWKVFCETLFCLTTLKVFLPLRLKTLHYACMCCILIVATRGVNSLICSVFFLFSSTTVKAE